MLLSGIILLLLYLKWVKLELYEAALDVTALSHSNSYVLPDAAPSCQEPYGLLSTPSST